MKRAAALAMIIALLLTMLTGCGKPRSARALLLEFEIAYGIDHTVYSPDVPEGEAGYVSDEFFEIMYMYGESCVTDYAIAQGSDLSSISECAIFICDGEHNAERMRLYLIERLELLSSSAKLSGIDYPEGAFVKRYGSTVVMSVLADNARAERIFNKIL